MPNPAPRYQIPAQRFRSAIEFECIRFITTVQAATSPQEQRGAFEQMFTDLTEGQGEY